MKKVLLILALSGFIISCSGNEVTKITSNAVTIEVIQKEFIGTTWKLSKYFSDGNLKNVTTTSKADLKFEGDKFYGNGSINRYFGNYISNNNELNMSRIGSTMMAGPEESMKQEYIFTSLLEKVTSYQLIKGELNLFSGKKVILVLTAL